MTLSTADLEPVGGQPDPGGDRARAGSTGLTEDFDTVYRRVIAVLTGIVGEDYLEALDVGAETRFEADLELESMEIVQLADELIECYGARVDFIAWFADMELDALVDLSIAAVVSFIVSCLDSSPVGTES